MKRHSGHRAGEACHAGCTFQRHADQNGVDGWPRTVARVSPCSAERGRWVPGDNFPLPRLPLPHDSRGGFVCQLSCSLGVFQPSQRRGIISRPSSQTAVTALAPSPALFTAALREPDRRLFLCCRLPLPHPTRSPGVCTVPPVRTFWLASLLTKLPEHIAGYRGLRRRAGPSNVSFSFLLWVCLILPLSGPSSGRR